MQPRNWRSLQMKYNFETAHSRNGVGAVKWEMMKQANPEVPDSIVPFSVADMELNNAPEIVEGLKQYLDEMILGYTEPTDAYFEAVQNWMERRHGFRPDREWFILTPGIVPAISQLIAALTAPTDSVLITTPVYYPFRAQIEKNGRGVVENELLIVDGHYEIDFADFEEKAARPDVTMFILCTPHNPIGRVWTSEELHRLADICLKHHVLMVADEIHSDLIMPGHTHVSLGTFEQKYLNNTIICTAPSKTFNLAGLQTSNLFVPNADIREKLESAGGYSSLNIFGYKACELAYSKCEDWLEQLLVHLDGNRQFVEDFLAEKLPMIHAFPLEGTYLQWLDFRALGMDEKELEDFMVHKALWFTDEGYVFGEGGKGFERINLACTRQVLQDALDRLYAAIQERNA